MERIATLACFCGAALAFSSPSHGQASFTGLGTLPGYISAFRPQVSADGQWVVGTCWNEGSGPSAAFRWSQATGMQSVSSIVGTQVGSFVAISPDGTALAGSCVDPDPQGLIVAYRWRQSDGLRTLGYPAGEIRSEALGLSSGGAVVIGEGDSAFVQFRWTQATGMQVVQPLIPASLLLLNAVSADGGVIVGTEDSGTPPGDPFRAYRWVAGSPPSWLPGLWASAVAVSADGGVIAGSQLVNGSLEACTWIAGNGPHALPRVGGRQHAASTAISADGTTVVGTSYDASSNSCFIWRESLGAMDLQDYLLHLGADLDGWSGLYPTGVDGDGRTIVGSGTYAGHSHVWLARLAAPACYANCDGSAAPPILNIDDFLCFQGAFLASEPFANCDGSTIAPLLNVADFICFLNRYSVGCP